MGIWKKISIIAINEPKLNYVKWTPTFNINNNIWDIKLETIYDMPKQGNIFPGILHVELLAKDGSKTLINENINVEIHRSEES